MESFPTIGQAPRVPMIRVSSLTPVLRELDRLKLRTEMVLAKHVLTRAQLGDPYLEIPLARYLAFLEDAAKAARNEAFGATVGTGFRTINLGPVGLLFGASATLRRGLERLARALASWQDGTTIGLHDEEDRLVWTYQIDDPGLWPRRQDSEYSLAATIAIARDAFGAAGRPVEVQIEHGEPADPSVLARIYGIQPSFGQPGNRLVFDRAAADRVRRVEDPDLMTFLDRHVAELRRPKGDEGLVARVQGLIGLHLGHRSITLPLIASELGLSTRTLQRRLALQGTSLRELVLAARIELGRVHLREGRAANAEIARTLGYADATTFWRAFKTSTGETPSQARRKH